MTLYDLCLRKKLLGESGIFHNNIQQHFSFFFQKLKQRSSDVGSLEPLPGQVLTLAEVLKAVHVAGTNVLTSAISFKTEK